VIRIAVIVGVACLIFGGVGGALGAGGRLWNGTAKSLQSVATARACEKTDDVAEISFSETKYPHIRRHMLHAVHDGWPTVLVLHRKGADTRRDHALEGVPTKPGYDRDEYPPAVGRTRTATDVELVPSGENRSHGSAMGVKLRRFCDGQKFRYVFY